MDTISIKLNFIPLKKISIREVEKIKKELNLFKSEFGYRYIDVLEYNLNGYVIKMSYPRYFKGTNAFLITKKSECFKVQEYFIQQLINTGILNFFHNIYLIRVDIPFTYYMKENFSFHHYKNIFKAFAYIYREQEQNASPKAIQDILTDRQETLYYANTKIIANYNARIMIYNQDLNIQNKAENNEEYNKIVKEFPDLKRRIRIEVSKRIRRNPIKICDFPNFDIIEAYFIKFKNYLLNNLINIEILKYIHLKEAMELEEILLFEKEKRNFTYELFIMKNITKIWDYLILRKAIRASTPKINTQENAITSIRKILKKYEERYEIIILETFDTIYDIHERINGIIFLE